MKKIISILLCVILIFSLNGCGFFRLNEDINSNETTNTSQQNPKEDFKVSKVDANKMVDLVNEINELEKNDYGQQYIKAHLEKIEWIENVSETADGGLTCCTKFGVTGVWTPENENTIGNASAITKNQRVYELSITSMNSYDIDSIAVLCPYASVDPNFNLGGYNFLGETMGEYTGCTVTFFYVEEVSLELLKKLDQFDMVWFYSHGALSNIFNSAWAIVDSDPYTMTGEFVNSPEAYALLSSDFFYGRTVVNLSDGRIGVGGNFYKHYYSENQLDGMFFHFASCNSMRTDKLADGILSRGAAWVQGWDNSVNFNNDYMQFTGVIANLLEGDNIKQAIIDADSLVEDEYDFYQEDCKLKGIGEENYTLKTIDDIDSKISLEDMPIVAHDSYKDNEGDSTVFNLNGKGLTQCDDGRTYKRYGNTGVDGTTYSNGFEVWIARWNYADEISWASATFDLDSKYKSLTGKTNLIKSYNTTNFDTTVYFYDGEKLLASYRLTNSDYIKDICVDVTGVKHLKLYVKDNVAVSGGTSFALYDMFLDSTTSQNATNKIIPSDAFEYDGHYYKIYDESLSWSEASNFCQTLCGRLVTIKSKEEQDFLIELSASSQKKNLWIGAKIISDNNYSWTTREPFEYMKRAESEPDNI